MDKPNKRGSKENEMGFPYINMKPQLHTTNALGTKTLEERMRAVNPAEAYGNGPNLKTSPGSVANIRNK